MTNPPTPESLPPIPFWLARSTYAMILTAVTTAAAAFDVDSLARLGTTEGGLLAAVDGALPLVSAAGLCAERRKAQLRFGV